jgi:hypothetical protein
VKTRGRGGRGRAMGIVCNIIWRADVMERPCAVARGKDISTLTKTWMQGAGRPAQNVHYLCAGAVQVKTVLHCTVHTRQYQCASIMRHWHCRLQVTRMLCWHNIIWRTAVLYSAGMIRKKMLCAR